MRNHFIIYLAAGLVVFFAMPCAIIHICGAINIQYAIRRLQPTGLVLAQLQAACSDNYLSAIEFLALVGLLGVIIVYTWKLKGQVVPPNNQRDIDMHALKLPKHSADAAFLAASALVALGGWVFFHTPGKNGFDTFPLFWLFVVVCGPLLSAACVVVMSRQRASAWMISLSTLLLLPQGVVWFYAVMGVLHYLGLVK
jgi:hypothetical protein